MPLEYDSSEVYNTKNYLYDGTLAETSMERRVLLNPFQKKERIPMTTTWLNDSSLDHRSLT